MADTPKCKAITLGISVGQMNGQLRRFKSKRGYNHMLCYINKSKTASLCLQVICLMRPHLE